MKAGNETKRTAVYCVIYNPANSVRGPHTFICTGIAPRHSKKDNARIAEVDQSKLRRKELPAERGGTTFPAQGAEAARFKWIKI